jgi:hypothetical protein
MRDALDEARTALRSEQLPAGIPSLKEEPAPVTDAALARFHELTQAEFDERRERLRRGPFSYDLESERDRIALGEKIIRRVQPGPYEDPNYFALLTYQAASVEATFADVLPKAFDNYMLGTVHAAEVNAFSQRSSARNYVIVVLNSGLVDFAYQAAKVVVEATEPKRTNEKERGLVKASADPGEIAAHLENNSGPMDRLYRTFEAYFFAGYPRATTFEVAPPDLHGPPLSILVGMAERFVIAHEYGHGIAPPMGDAPPEVNQRRAEEYSADSFATLWTVQSAAKLDGLQPEFPLAGGIFVLACLDLRRRALSLLLTGDEHWMAAETETHPAPRDRAAEIVSNFRRCFDVKYSDDGFDLWLKAPTHQFERPPAEHGLTSERADRCFLQSRILHMVWNRMKHRLVDDRQKGRPLHKMWQ